MPSPDKIIKTLGVEDHCQSCSKAVRTTSCPKHNVECDTGHKPLCPHPRNNGHSSHLPATYISVPGFDEKKDRYTYYDT